MRRIGGRAWQHGQECPGNENKQRKVATCLSACENKERDRDRDRDRDRERERERERDRERETQRDREIHTHGKKVKQSRIYAHF